MSKVIVLAALVMSLSLLLACSDDDTSMILSPTAISSPTNTLQVTPQVTPTRRPDATPTRTVETIVTPTPTPSPGGQDSNRAQAIAPLKVGDLKAFLSQLSPVEQTCLSDNDIGHQELTQMTGLSPGGSHEATATIIDCLQDETILRLFLTSLVGLSEPFSTETSICIESVVCMNDDEWDIYAPRLGMQPEFREGVACLFEELGGSAKLADAVQASSLGEPEDLVVAMEACGEETSQPTSAPDPSPSPSLDDAETAIRTLQWVKDGMTVEEQKAVIQLLYIASECPLNAWELTHKAWMQNDLSASENQAIVLLASIVHIDEISAEQVVGMPFLESIERNDIEVLETLSALDQEGLRWVLSHPSLAEVSADTLRPTVALMHLEWERPEAAATLKALPWVNDGIGTSEVEAVLQLQELALVSPKVFHVLAHRPWVRDRLGSNEITVVTSLRGISSLSSTKRDESAALRIADMPFLKTVDGVDAAAVSSLNHLFWASDDENYLTQALAHPALEDGISNEEAFVVAALGVVIEDRPDLLDTLLDLGPTVVEKRVIELPLAGDVTISVLNVDPGKYSTINILEQALRAQEAFMDVPLPRSYVGLLVADATPHGGGGGPSGLITVDPIYAEDKYIIAHELAHIYWAFSPKWIAEGGADFMTTVSVDKRFSSDACIGDTLFGLDSTSRQSPPTIDLSNCAYVLGRGLFLDLYATLGTEAFRTGFGRLYLSMRDSKLYDECSGLEWGLCYVRAAFVADATTESAASAGPVIDRWYYGPRQ